MSWKRHRDWRVSNGERWRVGGGIRALCRRCGKLARIGGGGAELRFGVGEMLGGGCADPSLVGRRMMRVLVR